MRRRYKTGMPRKCDKTTNKAEPLDPNVIKRALNEAIPYRLDLMRQCIEHCPAQTPKENPYIETGVLTGRLLMEFLGLKVEKDRTLKCGTNYLVVDGFTDDVKAPDVGGAFVELSELGEDETEMLGEFFWGANKACAHFTLDSGHALEAGLIKDALCYIERLVRRKVPGIPEI